MIKRFIELLRHRKIYSRLTLGFIMLSVAVIVVLSILFRRMYTTALYDEVTANDQNNLAAMTTNIENLMEEIDYIYLTVISNPVVSNYLTDRVWNPIKEHNVKKEFNRFKNIHSKVYSMYIYNGSMDYFISTESAGKDSPAFFDRGVIDHATGYKKYAAREITNDAGLSQRVISIIYSRFALDTKQLQSSIIINVLDFAQRGMLGDGAGLETLLLDRSGSVISSVASEDAIAQMAGADGFNTILSSPDQCGSFRITSGQTSRIVSFHRLAVDGWTLVSLQDYRHITAAINTKTNRIFVIAVAMLLISALFVILLSNSIYSPIDLLIQRLKKADYPSLSGDRQSGKNELDYIMNSFVEVIDQMQQIQEKNDKNSTELKQSFIWQLLTKEMREEAAQQKITEYGLDVECNDLVVLVIRVDERYKIKSEPMRVLSGALRQIALDACRDNIAAETALTPQGDTVMIVNTADDWLTHLTDAFVPPPDDERNALRRVMYEIKGKAYRTLGCSITIGVGTPAETIMDICASYRAACEMADNRFVLGYGQIITGQMVKDNLAVYVQLPEETERALADAIRLNRKEEFWVAFDCLISDLSKCEYESANMLLMQIFLTCIREMTLIVGGQSDAINARVYSLRLQNLETIEQANQLASELFSQYQQCVEELNLQKNTNKMQKIVQEALQYIRKNYSDDNLTIVTLAEKAGYSTSYFARMFNDVTGSFINDYIRKFRIDKAKSLLVETNLTVGEIATLVGYANTNYFYYAFKKETGMTPISYRGAHREME